MRPILLKCHTRPVTDTVFNRDGDLLITTGKDSKTILWRTENGERIGTYDGHTGAVYEAAINYSCTRLATASADESVRVWDIATGEQLHRIQNATPARSVDWDATGTQLVTLTDAVRGRDPHVFIYSWDDATATAKATLDIARYLPQKLKFTQAKWGPVNKYIAVAAEDGSMHIFDPEKQQIVKQFRDHTKPIASFSFDRHGLLFITASKDGFAKLYDARTFKHLKTYDTGRPVNSAAISPIRNEVLLGGGQEAGLVTTTTVDNAQFKAIFYDLVHQEELGRVAGHFGPINSVAYCPDGRGFVSGGEDGFIRLHRFDKSYFDQPKPSRR